MAVEAKTRQPTREDDDSVDRDARELADILGPNDTGEWEALIDSLSSPPQEYPR